MSKRNTRKSKSVPPVAIAASVVTAPSHEQIARRAYELYLQRGAQHGCDLQDWIAAERELAIHAA